MTYQYINPEKITNILFDDTEYVIEFCEAGVTSFKEFLDNYQKHLMNRNLEDFRKAGHKIKPGAQMMGADEVIEEYEKAKSLLQNGANNGDLSESVNKMEEICTTIQKELSKLAENQRAGK